MNYSTCTSLVVNNTLLYRLESAVESFTKIMNNDENSESPTRRLSFESEQADSIGHTAKTMMADQVS